MSMDADTTTTTMTATQLHAAMAAASINGKSPEPTHRLAVHWMRGLKPESRAAFLSTLLWCADFGSTVGWAKALAARDAITSESLGAHRSLSLLEQAHCAALSLLLDWWLLMGRRGCGTKSGLPDPAGGGGGSDQHRPPVPKFAPGVDGSEQPLELVPLASIGPSCAGGDDDVEFVGGEGRIPWHRQR